MERQIIIEKHVMGRSGKCRLCDGVIGMGCDAVRIKVARGDTVLHAHPGCMRVAVSKATN